MVIFRQLDKNIFFKIEIKNFLSNFLRQIFFLAIKTIDYQKKTAVKNNRRCGIEKSYFCFLTQISLQSPIDRVKCVRKFFFFFLMLKTHFRTFLAEKIFFSKNILEKISIFVTQVIFAIFSVSANSNQCPKARNHHFFIKLCQNTKFSMGFKKKNIRNQNLKIDFFYLAIFSDSAI